MAAQSAAGKDHTPTAVALSGGGHRATLFGLGALLALAHTCVNRDVTSVASVSGGSLANGALAARLDYAGTSFAKVRGEVEQLGRLVTSPPRARSGLAKVVALVALVALAGALLIAPWWLTPGRLGVSSGWIADHLDLARVIAVAAGGVICGIVLRVALTGGGPLFGWWGTWAYFAAVLALAEATFAGIPRVDGVSHALLYAVGAALLIAAVGWRGGLTALAFGSTLFPDGARTRLADVERTADHVICATDLHAGEHVYFAPEFVYAYRFGKGHPGRLPLRTPVQASAGFPGAFPVRWVRRGRLGFSKLEGSENHKPPFLALVDGGVYDNMGDEWAQGAQGRPAVGRAAEALIVVNASASMPYGSVWTLALPVVGGALAFWREKSVLYDSGTAQRRRALIRQFDLAERGGGGMRGTLVHIGQSPYTGLARWAKADGPWAARADRAKQALEFLKTHGHYSQEEWTTIAQRNAAVPTTLVGFDADTSARLLFHAYVLTLVNASVFAGHELPTDPLTYAEVRALAAEPEVRT